jgi:predicted transglutaminase-like cysteine proteinase
MRFFENTRALRAIVLACGMALVGSSAGQAAGAVYSSGPAVFSGAASEPFGLPAAPVSEGQLREKWLGVEREIDDELLVLALCEEDRARCSSVHALRFLSIIDGGRARDGRARLGDINRAINLAIRSVSDEAQYGDVDVWRSPLALLATGAGDCEDYAIAKFVALRAAGLPSDDLRIVIMRDTKRGEDHAVTAVRLDGHWLLLDNRRMMMVEDANSRGVRPLFAIDRSGVRLYSEQPLLARAPELDPTPGEPMEVAFRTVVNSGQN